MLIRYFGCFILFYFFEKYKLLIYCKNITTNTTRNIFIHLIHYTLYEVQQIQSNSVT